MKIELTDEEVTTILIALDNYRDQQEMDFLRHPTNVEAQQEAGSAEWCWQKIMTAQETQTNNQTSASVDPFSMPSEEK
tara:strand:+ start:782 stop:1015 length:234 start_codon:yes stop_codon:yes gene_type:complete